MAETTSVEDTRTVFLSEEVVLDGVQELHESLRAVAGSDDVIIDASDARFIDSAGWQLLLAFFQKHEDARMINAPEGVHGQAHTLGIDQLIPLGDPASARTEPEAEEDLCPVF